MEQKDKELLNELIRLVQEGMGLVYDETDEEVMWKRKAVGVLNKAREVMND